MDSLIKLVLGASYRCFIQAGNFGKLSLVANLLRGLERATAQCERPTQVKCYRSRLLLFLSRKAQAHGNCPGICLLRPQPPFSLTFYQVGSCNKVSPYNTQVLFGGLRMSSLLSLTPFRRRRSLIITITFLYKASILLFVPFKFTRIIFFACHSIL
jgi:hypothetical protein